MFDVSKLQGASNLAKELVEKGIAKDFQDALKIIESNNMVKSNEEFKIINNHKDSEEQEEKIQEKEKANENTKSIEDSIAIKKIKEDLAELRDLFERYMTQNDNNLRELDTRLNNLESKIKFNQEVKEEKVKKPEPKKFVTGAGEGLNPDDFAVDKIFNNSNGRLEK
ncbi:MAG: hypothetical protein PWQ28_250 [Candidatus Woesearchaeota archaeon]|nr:hypothetical protein [Candidatus Woesearchaeota archaeon]